MNKSKSAIVLSTIIEKIQLVVGIIILVVFGLCTIVALIQTELATNGFLPFCLAVDAIGVVLIVFSRKRHNLIRAFKNYVAKLSNDPTGSIENLAAASGTSVDVVRKNLEKMIDKKYFPNATIDQGLNCIVFPNRKESLSFNTTKAKSTSNSKTITQQSQRSVTTSTDASDLNEAVAVINKAFSELDDALSDFIDTNYASEYAAYIESSDSTDVSTPKIVTITCNGCGGISTLLKGQTGECEYCGSVIQG